jgi:hypothetical protein
MYAHFSSAISDAAQSVDGVDLDALQRALMQMAEFLHEPRS